MPLVCWLERLLLVFGFVCFGWAGATWLDAFQFQREHSRVIENPSTATHAAMAPPRNTIDHSAPIGRLDIPGLDVSVVVMPGDDDATLNKAVGHLPDTPLPWNGGN